MQLFQLLLNYDLFFLGLGFLDSFLRANFLFLSQFSVNFLPPSPSPSTLVLYLNFSIIWYKFFFCLGVIQIKFVYISGARVGRQRSERQQEDENCASPHSTRRPKRRRAEQASRRCHDRQWRCDAQHPQPPPPQEDRHFLKGLRCRRRFLRPKKSPNLRRKNDLRFRLHQWLIRFKILGFYFCFVLVFLFVGF